MGPYYYGAVIRAFIFTLQRSHFFFRDALFVSDSKLDLQINDSLIQAEFVSVVSG